MVAAITRDLRMVDHRSFENVCIVFYSDIVMQDLKHRTLGDVAAETMDARRGLVSNHSAIDCPAC